MSRTAPAPCAEIGNIAAIPPGVERPKLPTASCRVRRSQ
jgi:hypothetical protein